MMGEILDLIMNTSFHAVLFNFFVLSLKLFLISSVDSNIIDPDLDKPVNSTGIITYQGPATQLTCVYCYDKYFSDTGYFEEDCRDQYLPKQQELEIYALVDENNRTFHRLCHDFEQYEQFRKGVECSYPLEVSNGTVHLFTKYSTKSGTILDIQSPVIGSKLKLTCYPGYDTDNYTSDCIVDREKPTWYPKPLCYRTGCYVMENPENGKISCEKVVDGIQENDSICNVTCDEGYEANVHQSVCIDRNYSHQFVCRKIPVEKESELDTWVKLGIGAGCVLFIVVSGILIFCWLKRYKAKKAKARKNLLEMRRPDYAERNGVLPGPLQEGGNDQPNGRPPGLQNGDVIHGEPEGPDQQHPPDAQVIPVPETESDEDEEPDSGSPLLSDSGIAYPKKKPKPSFPNPNQNPLNPEEPPSSTSSDLDTSKPSTSSTQCPPATGSVSKDESSGGINSSDLYNPQPGPSSPRYGLGSTDKRNPRFEEKMAASVSNGTGLPLSDGYSGTSSRDSGSSTNSKQPVEHEEVPLEDLDLELRSSKEPQENEDPSSILTLQSTGTDLVDMVRGLQSNDHTQTQLKQVEDCPHTTPKVLQDLIRPSVTSHGAGSDLSSKPSLYENAKKVLGEVPKDETPRRDMSPEQLTDQAYFSDMASNNTLPSNPTPLYTEDGRSPSMNSGLESNPSPMEGAVALPPIDRRGDPKNDGDKPADSGKGTMDN